MRRALTDHQYRALQILASISPQPMRPRAFARKMWPESTGRRIHWSAGGFLGKLERRGWARSFWRREFDWQRGKDDYHFDGYGLTAKGQNALNGARETRALLEAGK